jgi:hypothetical protein
VPAKIINMNINLLTDGTWMPKSLKGLNFVSAFSMKRLITLIKYEYAFNYFVLKKTSFILLNTHFQACFHKKKTIHCIIYMFICSWTLDIVTKYAWISLDTLIHVILLAKFSKILNLHFWRYYLK